MASFGFFLQEKSELKNLWFQLFQILKEPAEFIKEPAKNCGFWVVLSLNLSSTMSRSCFRKSLHLFSKTVFHK
jgi:hypothetical protein